MTFTLNKNMSRRRRLEAGDGNTKDDEGTFAYNMRSGKCVKKDDADTSCGDEGGDKTTTGGKGDGESFDLLLSLLALFAFY